jgi:hypothetical protein
MDSTNSRLSSLPRVPKHGTHVINFDLTSTKGDRLIEQLNPSRMLPSAARASRLNAGNSKLDRSRPPAPAGSGRESAPATGA